MEISKIFKKYTLEVDDAIEAHGFTASSYIDYAENTIAELEISVKNQIDEHGLNSVLSNLDNYLKNTSQNILNHTMETAYKRNNDYLHDKINDRIEDLNTCFKFLNTRVINSFE